QLRKRSDGPERKLLEIRGPLHGWRAHAKRLSGFVDRHAGNQRTEVKRRRHVIRNLNLSECLVSPEAVVHGSEHGLFIFIRELQAGRRERQFQHLLGHLLCALLLHAGPQYSRQQRPSESDGGKVTDKTSASLFEILHMASQTRQRRVPGKGWIVVLPKMLPVKSVCSPALRPGTGSRRTARGLFQRVASHETSPIMRAICSSVTSPGRGTVSTPP